MLFRYTQEVQRLLRDTRQELLNPADLASYINQARNEIALRAQCIRILTPISGSVISAEVTNPGSGYVAPVVTITPPDFPTGTGLWPNGAQAKAQATQIGGSLAAVNIIFGGSGYFQPQAEIIDTKGNGSGAAVSLSVQNINLLNQGQEVYPFSSVDLSPFPGVGEIYTVKSCSIIYANYRYSVPIYSFSTYQAFIRQYPFQYQYVPTVGSQFGQGTSGSFYLYPIPSQVYQIEWDCLCLPEELVSDTTPEIIPRPWTYAVKYFAAHLAYLELQNMNYARMMLDMFEKQLNIYSTSARPGRASNPYGRF
jgi:hypothetical protein